MELRPGSLDSSKPTPNQPVTAAPSRERSPLALLAVFATLLLTLSLSGCVGSTSAGSPASKSNSIRTSSGTLNASTSSLKFASASTSSSSNLGVTLTNAGNSNVTVSNVSISGAGFTASGVSTGQILTPGQTASLNVTFTPAAATCVTRSVTVASNA